jgi:hypothetical protein
MTTERRFSWLKILKENPVPQQERKQTIALADHHWTKTHSTRPLTYVEEFR